MARARKIWLVRDTFRQTYFVYYGRKPSYKRRNKYGSWLGTDDKIDEDLLKAAGIKLLPGQGPIQLCIRLNL